ncbi:nitronate monooxygenase [Rossellomorea aquimaris]|uniref:nitronate monooxygenase n=1 Tax=Rossellomorea aquimaris TaxID=189382 RepID=UPI001CD62798|nr:nitronate monooxygenase [Rossellomorea aquimaris]MCA1054077.1 nitronate monooxygenase [Rossellomorea aquimaris]
MNNLMKILSLSKPIIQAPMAGGATTPTLAAAVSKEGGLGSLASGYLTPEMLEEQLIEMTHLTDRAFQVNLFVPKKEEVPSEQKIQKWKEIVPFADKAKPFPTMEEEWKDFYSKVALLVKHRVNVCSFTFDLPPEDAVNTLKAAGCYLLGTACSVEEAVLMEQRGMDAVILQGAEAGGHQGAFLPSTEPVALMPLLSKTVEHISIPVIAAGGISDRRRVQTALEQGAQCVQIGTAFLICEESSAHPVHKQQILSATGNHTRLTKVFSGKEARGIVNDWMEDHVDLEEETLPYPYLNTLTKPMRQEAANNSDPSHMSLWAGEGVDSLKKEMTVRELIRDLLEEE